MSDDLDIVFQQEAADDGDTSAKRLRAVISDAFAFIRSQEANQALATVTIEQLINDQILRNGDSDRSDASKYDPYSFDPEKDGPASQEPAARANVAGGSDTNRPTKLDRVLALQNAIDEIVDTIKEIDPVDVADPEEYTDSLEDSI